MSDAANSTPASRPRLKRGAFLVRQYFPSGPIKREVLGWIIEDAPAFGIWRRDDACPSYSLVHIPTGRNLWGFWRRGDAAGAGLEMFTTLQELGIDPLSADILRSVKVQNAMFDVVVRWYR